MSIYNTQKDGRVRSLGNTAVGPAVVSGVAWQCHTPWSNEQQSEKNNSVLLELGKNSPLVL